MSCCTYRASKQKSIFYFRVRSESFRSLAHMMRLCVMRSTSGPSRSMTRPTSHAYLDCSSVLHSTPCPFYVSSCQDTNCKHEWGWVQLWVWCSLSTRLWSNTLKSLILVQADLCSRFHRNCKYDVDSIKPMALVFELPKRLSRDTDQFTEFYYQTFDQNRANLAALYVRLDPSTEKWQADSVTSAITQCWPSREHRYKALLPSLRSSQWVLFPKCALGTYCRSESSLRESTAPGGHKRCTTLQWSRWNFGTSYGRFSGMWLLFRSTCETWRRPH